MKTTSTNGRAKLPLSPDQNVPTERVCRVCGGDKTQHSHLHLNAAHEAAENDSPSPGGEGRGEGGITPSPTLLSPVQNSESHGPHTCLAPNCGTLLDPEDFFCEYHFQKLPADLLWAYIKSADGPPRQMLLQQMADHLEREASSHLELLRECAEFLDSIGRVELFRCVKCRSDQTIFIDDEVANRFDSLLNRVMDATLNPGRAKLPLSPDQKVPSPDLFGALKAIEQLTRGTMSTHVHQIASDTIKAAEAQ